MPKFVHVTDGNELSIQNVQNSLRLNHFTCTIKASVLKWETINRRNLIEKEKYKFILSADCLFFDDSRTHLIDAIKFYLSPDGVALITAPQRGKTLHLFMNECVQRGFKVELVDNYNDYIWEKHLEMKNQAKYDDNVHYPLLIKLYKKDYDKNHI
jgi:calmodulin-lysine N-methyltransferase